MRIASYNIMSGGFNSYNTTSAAPQRLPLLQKAIREIGADIIGLVDTYRWNEIYTEADLKRLFGYKYAYCINLNDERQRLPTMPTSLFPAKVDEPFLRIDYCLYSPPIPVSNLTVHYGAIFNQASDHFPISLTVA